MTQPPADPWGPAADRDDSTRAVPLPPVPPPAPRPPIPGPPSYTPPSYAPPSYGPPSYGSPSYGPPSYGTASYGPPSYDPPAWSPPPYGPAGHPGPGVPPGGRPRRSLLPVVLGGAAALVLGVALGLFLVLRGGGTGTTASAASSATTTGAPSTTRPPSPNPAAGGASVSSRPTEPSGAPGGALNDEGSPDFAATWLAELVTGADQTAYDQLCPEGRSQFGDAAALRADFDGFLGGTLVDGEVTDQSGASDGDYVFFTVDLADGSTADLAVFVVSEASGLSVCGYLPPSEAQ